MAGTDIRPAFAPDRTVAPGASGRPLRIGDLYQTIY
jgi:hypothetical protein